MADLFALSKIQDEILFRNDEYVSPEKAKAIKRIRSAGSWHAVCSTNLDQDWLDCSHKHPCFVAHGWHFSDALHCVPAATVYICLIVTFSCVPLQRDADGGAAWCGGSAVRRLRHPRSHPARAHWSRCGVCRPVCAVPRSNWVVMVPYMDVQSPRHAKAVRLHHGDTRWATSSKQCTCFVSFCLCS